jgi:hypothetical protein
MYRSLCAVSRWHLLFLQHVAILVWYCHIPGSCIQITCSCGIVLFSYHVCILFGNCVLNSSVSSIFLLTRAYTPAIQQCDVHVLTVTVPSFTLEYIPGFSSFLSMMPNASRWCHLFLYSRMCKYSHISSVHLAFLLVSDKTNISVFLL